MDSPNTPISRGSKPSRIDVPRGEGMLDIGVDLPSGKSLRARNPSQRVRHAAGIAVIGAEDARLDRAHAGIDSEVVTTRIE
ncbi:hypothetical protein ACIRRA_07140 [Nocardia sp. NPDC101769]|uniref:hypothetical protein n=1 Tax=Nocardia sp. NPDC101769 TaxID=3364333 RepID=UPI00382D8794